MPERVRRYPFDLCQARVLLHSVPQRVGCEWLAGPAPEEWLGRVRSALYLSSEKGTI